MTEINKAALSGYCSGKRFGGYQPLQFGKGNKRAGKSQAADDHADGIVEVFRR